MLTIDTTDIAYRYLVVFVGLSAITVFIVAIIGYVLDRDRRKLCDESSRYRMYGYCTAAILVILDILTYIIPSSYLVNFMGDKMFCIILGGFECCIENMLNFYIIGSSVYMLTIIYSKFRNCIFRADKINSKYIYITWMTCGLVCGVFYMLFGIFSASIGPSGNRCWFIKGFGNISPLGIKAFAYLTLFIFTTVFSIVCAILSHIQVNTLKKNAKEACMNTYSKDNDTYRQVSKELSSFDKNLLKNYTIFVVATLLLVIMALIFEFVYRRDADDSAQQYSEWADTICILAMFLIGIPFNRDYIILFINKFRENAGSNNTLVLN